MVKRLVIKRQIEYISNLKPYVLDSLFLDTCLGFYQRIFSNIDGDKVALRVLRC